MSAVELPANLQIALADYPQCDKRTQRPGGIVERCAKPSEWAIRCNRCGAVAMVCDEHGAEVANVQRPQGCAVCKQVGLVPLRWTFIFLRCRS
ncbi:hypothetical protein [Curtobacterium sp. MCBD17_028]|uniref:hypothetical protein n=1 Tax=Curtobacterium sp. MCBD17_028 TaxID=2175670 RepID=UPI000DA99CAF|nr:hypothetical protein [Curtobacterium sp. MCBD17_028]PZE23890.1 hypothetical protein DEI86_13685 [Curtobacterium sp. MCBD17_028]